MKIAKFPSLNKDFEKGKIKIRKGKKPYIYQDGKISKFKIWIVDGEYIRKNICEDFVNLGQHYLYKFIPKNEFWIAKEAYEGEENYYVDHLLIENKLMASGVPYEKAYIIAAKTEKKEIWIDNDIPEKERKFIILHEIHERNLMEKGIGYKNAHYSATKIEDFARQNPKKINLLIKQEII